MVPDFIQTQYVDVGVASGASEARGMTALQDIPPNTTFLSIPHEYVLTPTQALYELVSMFGFAEPSLDDLNAESCVILFLVLMRRHTEVKTRHRVLIDGLPQRSEMPPFFELWAPQEVAFLEQPIRTRALTRRLRRLQTLYKEIVALWDDDAVVAVPCVSEDDVCWGYDIIDSRAFNLSDHEDKDTWCLLPFADLFNHCPVNGVTEFGYNADTRSFNFATRSDQSFAPASPVLLRYATADAGLFHFAHHYGFVPESVAGGHEPSSDYFPVTLPPDSDEEGKAGRDPSLTRLAAWKIIQDHNLADPYELYISYGGVASPNLLAALRTLYCQDHEFKMVHLLVVAAENGGVPPVVSARNERQVVEYLLWYVRSSLERYTTTIEQDIAGLAKSSSNPKATMAFRLRIRDKEVLTSSLVRLEEQYVAMTSSEPATAQTRLSAEVADSVRVLTKIVQSPSAFLRTMRF
eukprot:PhM_4_TR5444/c0_g1_i1/m.77811